MGRVLGVTLLNLFPMFSLFVGAVQAEVVGKEVTYTQGNTVLKGYVAADTSTSGKRPGVLVIHEWWGLNDYARSRADELARMGYVAFAADMYGDGITTTDAAEAARLASGVRGTPLMPERARAALRALLQDERVDSGRIAAIGFCFGGTGVLDLAYSGADIAGIVSFHGGLTVPTPKDLQAVKAKMLVLHGADDPHVPPETVDAFQSALRKSKVDWQMNIYGGAVHAYTNPAAGSDKSKGSAYNRQAAERSWKAMQVFFQELFGQPSR